MPTVPSRFFRRLQDHGLGRTLRHLEHRLSERVEERRLGIRTAGMIPLDSLGISDPLFKCYSPVAYRSFRAVMKHVSIQPDRDVFLDYGAGKGRVVVLAATYPFHRILGVEVSARLSAAARENVRRAAPKLRCPDVELVTADAALYELPDNVSVLHFFDPFHRDLLARVLERIRASLLRAPRIVTILFADTLEFDPLASSCGWIRLCSRVPFPYAEGKEPPGRYSYGIYQAAL